MTDWATNQYWNNSWQNWYQPWNNVGTWNQGWMSYPTWNQPWSSSVSMPWSSSVPSSSTSDEKKVTSQEKEPVLSFSERVAQVRFEKDKDKIIKEIDAEKNIKEFEEQKQQIEKNKKADGSSSVTVSTKKQGFWGKAGRWLSNAGSALANMGKSFVGIEEDGSWNWKKCLKNVGIAAAVVGATFIPVVGPVISAGLLATGVVSGAVGVAKGVSKLNDARTDAEVDKAQQDICSAAFVGLASIFGLRGLGKGFRTSATTASQASSAAARSGIGKVVESASNFGRDMTVNAFKATASAVKADKAAIAGQGISGFFKEWGTKMSDSWRSFGDWKERYKKQHKELETSLNNKLNDITNKLNTETNAAKRALLQEEKSMLELNLAELRSLGSRIKTKADYEKLLKDNSAKFNKEWSSSYTQNSRGGYEINGRTIAPERYNQFYSSVNRTQKLYESRLKDLIKTKENLMRQLAKHPEKNLAELDAYVPTRTVSKNWLKPSTWRKNEYQLAIGGKNPGKYKELLGVTLTSPAAITTVWTDRAFDETPLYSTPFMYGQDFTPEETEMQIQALEQQIEQYKTAISAIENAKNKEELNAIIAVLNGEGEQGAEQENV